MLRSLKHKYIAYNGGARPEQLFDLSNDPGETRNLAQLDPASPLLKQCRTELAAWAAAWRRFPFPS